MRYALLKELMTPKPCVWGSQLE